MMRLVRMGISKFFLVVLTIYACTFLLTKDFIKFMQSKTAFRKKLPAMAWAAVCLGMPIRNPHILIWWIPAVTVISIVVVATWKTLQPEYKDSTGEKNTERNNSSYRTSSMSGNRSMFFSEGMSMDKAKRRYRILLKKYHPDNTCGSSDMAEKIISEYKNFCEKNCSRSA